MRTIKDLHNQAMELVEEAEDKLRAGDPVGANGNLRQAFEHERAAAMQLIDRANAEPTRSILFRGAATLANRAGLRDEAEQMVALALSGSSPSEIAAELLALDQSVNAGRIS
jgi:hypothetical protein